uniref:hypothetical protein n=1 Tax=Corynebacterium sp. 52A TaxID=2080502 RepID=UPI00210742A1|nr:MULTISPECIES: hypothetical protein [Corynebacterium]
MTENVIEFSTTSDSCGDGHCGNDSRAASGSPDIEPFAHCQIIRFEVSPIEEIESPLMEFIWRNRYSTPARRMLLANFWR